MSQDLSSLFQESEDDDFFNSINKSAATPFPPLPANTVIHSELLHVSHPGLASTPLMALSQHHGRTPEFGVPEHVPPSGPSLIASLRETRKFLSTMEPLQPEQDVIYNKPPATEVLPPPKLLPTPQPPFMAPNRATHVVVPSRATHIARGPFDAVTSLPHVPHAPDSVAHIFEHIPLPSAPHVTHHLPPLSAPLAQIPHVSSDPLLDQLSAPANGTFVSPPATHTAYAPVHATRRGGLQVVVSLGFGGRVVVAGGRFGSRVGLGTLSSLLSAEPWLRDIQCGPGPLGSVSEIVTENISSFLNRKQNNTCPFSWSALPDAEIMSLFLTNKSVASFLAQLGTSVMQEYQEGVLHELVRCLVRTDMLAAIQLAKQHYALHPFVMAFASIHSAEYFREAILAFAGAAVEENACILENSVLLQILKTVISVFASTSPLFPPIDKAVLQHWKLYLALVGSFAKDKTFLHRLGTALVKSGKVLAGQTCMLVTKPSLDSVDSMHANVCLIGVDHKTHVGRILDPYALQMSEVFEYKLRSGNSSFFVGLQPLKFAYAAMLAGDLGLFELADKYLTVVNAFIKAVPTGQFAPQFRVALRELEDRIGKAASPSVGGNTVGTLGAIWTGIKSITSSI